MKSIKKLETFVELKKAEEELKEKALDRQIEILKDEIEMKWEKAEELIKMGKICVENNIRFPYVACGWGNDEKFVANGYTHKIGFLKRGRIIGGIAILGGCDYHGAVFFENGKVVLNMGWSQSVKENEIVLLKRFLNEFDGLYDSFCEWVDEITEQQAC